MIKVKIKNETMYFLSEIELEVYCKLNNIELETLTTKRETKKDKKFFRFNSR